MYFHPLPLNFLKQHNFNTKTNLAISPKKSLTDIQSYSWKRKNIENFIGSNNNYEQIFIRWKLGREQI